MYKRCPTVYISKIVNEHINDPIINFLNFIDKVIYGFLNLLQSKIVTDEVVSSRWNQYEDHLCGANLCQTRPLCFMSIS
jgi:hypothetical protein